MTVIVPDSHSTEADFASPGTDLTPATISAEEAIHLMAALVADNHEGMYVPFDLVAEMDGDWLAAAIFKRLCWMMTERRGDRHRFGQVRGGVHWIAIPAFKLADLLGVSDDRIRRRLLWLVKEGWLDRSPNRWRWDGSPTWWYRPNPVALDAVTCPDGDCAPVIDLSERRKARLEGDLTSHASDVQPRQRGSRNRGSAVPQQRGDLPGGKTSSSGFVSEERALGGERDEAEEDTHSFSAETVPRVEGEERDVAEAKGLGDEGEGERYAINSPAAVEENPSGAMRTMPVWLAKIATPCPACGKLTEVGKPIAPNPDPNRQGLWIHRGCFDPALAKHQREQAEAGSIQQGEQAEADLRDAIRQRQSRGECWADLVEYSLQRCWCAGNSCRKAGADDGGKAS